MDVFGWRVVPILGASGGGGLLCILVEVNEQNKTKQKIPVKVGEMAMELGLGLNSVFVCEHKMVHHTITGQASEQLYCRCYIFRVRY